MAVVSLIAAICIGVDKYIVRKVKNKHKEWKALRCKNNAKQREEERKAELVFNPKKPNISKLESGLSEFTTLYRSLKRRGEVKGQPDWDSDVLVAQLEEKCYYDEDYDSVYFVSFRRFCRGKNWRKELARLREEDERLKEKLRLEKEESDRKKTIRKQKRDAFFSKIFGWSKTFFQWLALIVALPVAVFAAYWLYRLAIFIAEQLLVFLKFAFVTHIDNTVLYTACGVFGVAVPSFLYAFFSAEFFRKWFWRPVGRGIEISCDNVIVPVAKTISFPLIWIGKWVFKGFEFIYDFGRMFMSENCPHITWEDAKPVTPKKDT